MFSFIAKSTYYLVLTNAHNSEKSEYDYDKIMAIETSKKIAKILNNKHQNSSFLFFF